MPNLFTPNTTVIPKNPKDSKKLDEMIKLLQDQINNTIKMQQYSQTQEQKQKALLTETATKEALKSLYYDKPEYEPLRKFFDDPNITSGVMGGLINQAQEITVKDRVAQNIISSQEQDKIDREFISLPIKNFKSIDDVTKKAVEMGASNQALVQQRMSFNDYEKGVREEKGLASGGTGSGEVLLSQAKGKNIKSQLRNEGMIVGGNRVYIRGDDTSPYAHSGYYRLKDGVYSKKVGSQWLEVGAEIKTDKKTFDIVKIPESVKTSLNEAIEKFQTANIDAKGKTTTSSTTTTPVKRVKFIP